MRPLVVLIVDESAMLRAMLKRVIQISGVPLERVFEVTTAAAGMAVLEAHPVDVVFASLDPSQRLGHKLLQAIVNRSQWPTLIRVATSTRGMPDDQLASLGVQGRLGTPYTPEAVREAMAPLLRGDAAKP